MMSMLKRIKGLVFIDESVDAKNAETAIDDDSLSRQSSPPPAVVSEPSAVATDGAIGLDVAAVEARIDRGIKSNPAFAQFGDFLKLAENMKVAIPDEAQRFKASQAATGTPVETLISSASSYSDVLKKESSIFENRFVLAIQAEIKALDSQEQDLGNQIDELAAKIAELSTQKNEVSHMALAKAGELSKAETDFEAVTATLESRYRNLVKKAQQHLRSVPNGQ